MGNEVTDFDLLQEVIDKSETEFENKLTLLATGTLILSLSFIEKIIPFEKNSGVWFLVGGWIFLILTLIINFVSHLLTKQYVVNSQNEIINGKTIEERTTSIKERNCIIEIINKITVGTLISGIILITFFVSINTIRKANYNSQKDTKNKISVSNEFIKINDSTILIKLHYGKKK